MILYLQAKLSELNLAYFEFFQVAYFWKYQKHYLSNSDCAEFVLHGIVPKYVQEYLRHLQENEHAHCGVLPVRENSADECTRSEALPSALREEENNP